MSESLTQKVDDLATTLGADQLRQDRTLNKLLPPDAQSLDNQALAIYGGTTSKITAYLSDDAAAAYKAGDAAGSQVNYMIKDATFVLATPNTADAVNAGDQGVLELHINGSKVDEFDLAAAYNPANEDGNQTWTPANSTNGKLTITSVGVYNSVWQKLNARLNIVPADLVKGFNTLTLKHTGTGLNQVSQDFEVFYDDATNAPTVSIPTLAVHNQVSKWLSGVEYIGQGSVLKVGAVGSNLYDNTYRQDPLTTSGLSGAPNTNIAPNDASVTGLSNPPKVGEVMTVTDKLITLSTANQCSADARVTVTPKRPSGNGSAQTSASQNLAVNTFGNRSTDTVEYFDDEQYRLPVTGWDDESGSATKTGNWDSTAALPAGEAQQGIVSNNNNGLVTTGQHKRYFLSGSTAKSSIQMAISGTIGTLGQVGSGDTNVEIKLPGQTGWMDAIRPYGGNPAALTADGAGCMASVTGNTIVATFGTYSNFGSNYRCLVRITSRTANSKPTQVTTNW